MLEFLEPILDEDHFGHGLGFPLFHLHHQESLAIGRNVPGADVTRNLESQRFAQEVWVGSLSAFAQPPDKNPHMAMPSLYSAVLDYEAGWLTGTNPKGVWSYGWSSDLTTPITLFSHYWLYADNGVLEHVWDDPDNNYGLVPKVSRNSGGDYDNGNVSFNAGTVALHHGVGTAYAHVIFTAPSHGLYSIAATFCAQQHNISADIHVLIKGKAYFSDTTTNLGESHSFTELVALRAGETVDFAVGPNGNPELHPGYTGLEAVVAKIHP